MAVYCTSDDVASILSSQGIEWAVDDDRTGNTDGVDELRRVTDCISRASSKINQYVVKWYQLSTLASNTWVKWCCATLAAVALMRRRGDTAPDGLISEYDEYLEFLKDVQLGKSVIPSDGTDDAKLLTQNAGMTMSNLHMDQRYRNLQLRVITRMSTGPLQSKGGISRVFDYTSLYYIE